MLFMRLGVSVSELSRQEFTLAYYGLARRYHPDCGEKPMSELMATINAARTIILREHRWAAVPANG